MGDPFLFLGHLIIMLSQDLTPFSLIMLSQDLTPFFHSFSFIMLSQDLTPFSFPFSLSLSMWVSSFAQS